LYSKGSNLYVTSDFLEFFNVSYINIYSRICSRSRSRSCSRSRSRGRSRSRSRSYNRDRKRI